MNQIREHHIEVRKSARYYTLGPSTGDVRHVWFLLHGYGQLAGDFLAECTPLAAPDTLLVAPEALSRLYSRAGRGGIGASWMTREDREAEIADYIAYLDGVWETLRERHGEELSCSVLGFSQGGATAARWGMFGAARPDPVVIWGTTLQLSEYERNPDRLAGMHLIFVNGRADRIIDRREWDEAMRGLPNLGIRYEVIEHQGGHVLDEDVLKRLKKPASVDSP